MISLSKDKISINVEGNNVKRVICLTLSFILAFLFANVSTAETRSAPVEYNRTGISHRFDTGSISKPANGWKAKDTAASIVYVNSNDPTQIRNNDYHLVKFINQDGYSVGGSYHQVSVGHPYSVIVNDDNTTSVHARIKNRYYGTSESYYKMSTQGMFSMIFG